MPASSWPHRTVSAFLCFSFSHSVNNEEYQDMVQTQGRSGIDKRKILTCYGHKEDLDGLLLDTFWHSYHTKFYSITTLYIYIIQSRTSNIYIYMYIDYCV
jgi:hypothetical protein